MLTQKELDQARIDDLHRQVRLEAVIQEAIATLRRSCRDLESQIGTVFLKARKDYDETEWEYIASMPADIHKLCEEHHLKVSAQLGALQSLFARSFQGLKPMETMTYESQTTFSMRPKSSIRENGQVRPISNQVSNLLD